MAAGSGGDLGVVLARDVGHAALELVVARLAADGRSSRSSRMVTHPERVGARGQRRVHHARVSREVGVDDIEVVDVMRFAVHGGRGVLGIDAEAAGLRFWAMPAKGDLLAEHRPASAGSSADRSPGEARVP